jgi:uncharacterized membrane protein
VARWIAPAAALLALVWPALLVAAPALPVPVAALLYATGSLICHQLPERSFHLQMFQLPVCARCLGLYAGGALGSLGALAIAARPVIVGWPFIVGRLFIAGRPFTGRLAGRPRPLYTPTVIAALPTAITFALEWGLGWRISNLTRALAGVPLGLTVAFVVMRALATLHYGECTPRRPIASGQPPTHI